MIKRELLVGNKYVIGFDENITGEYSLSTDSRDISSKDAFVALDGESFRGVHFIENCLKSGVKLVIVKKDKESERILSKLRSEGHTFSVVYTKDTTHYLQEVARIFLNDWKKENKGVAIGITGSNGKTTGKDMLYHIINTVEPGKVWCTHKNFNNHIGVPLTILGLNSKHKFVIVEMGTNHPGELQTLCEIAPPSAGFITNIGESHLEFFHDKEGVFREKRALYDSILKNGGHFIINQDDFHLKNLSGGEKCFFFGEAGKDIKFTLLKNGFELNINGKGLRFENTAIKGNFNYFNMGMCVALGLILLPGKIEKVVEAANSFVPSDRNRSNWMILEKNKNVFLDAYNANPSSMMAALELFVQQVGENEDSLFILGDMNELGKRAGEFHRKVGSFLARQEVRKEVVFIGRHADAYNEGLGGGAVCHKTLASFQKDWPVFYLKYKNFFIKGSRSLQLESLIDINK